MSTDSWEMVRFMNHRGIFDKDENNVRFYGLRFSSILTAKEFLKNLRPGNYVPWAYKSHIGIRDPLDGSVFVECMWFGSEDDARLYFTYR